MFDSKSPTVKIVGYIIIGFFTLIIIISFGVPDFMSRLGMDQNTVAVVNGEKIHRLDYIRFRERFSHLLKESKNKEMERMILDNLIMKRLLIQKIDSLGIKISDERVKKSIKTIPYFIDKSGKFDNKIFKRYLEYSHQNLPDFYRMRREELLIDELRQLIETGVGITADDIRLERAIEKSALQIKYCFVSNKKLKKRYKDRITVSEKEIDDELKKSKEEIKDPKSDRNRIKIKLEKKKFDNIKKDMARKIDKLAYEKKAFANSQSIFNGEIFYSNIFKIGEQVRQKGKKGRVVYAINSSQVFKEDSLKIEIGKTSRAINSYDGIYVFTPIKKKINFKSPSQEEFNKIADKLMMEKNNAIFMTLLSSFREKSKITKSLNFN